MMDKTAIEQIQLSQAVTATQDTLDGQNLAHPVSAIHKDFRVESLEQFLPGKVRFTGEMHTKSIEDFACYTIDNKEKGSQCFIDKDRAIATAIFNLGDSQDAGHADFRAILELEKTAEFKSLLSLHDVYLAQKTLAEFMEDWADFITPLDKEGQPIGITKAISAVRRLTIEANAKAEHEVQDFRSTRSALENIEAKTDHGLPSELLFECEPFNGLPAFNFYVRLSIITGDEPKFSFRIKRLDKAEEEIMEIFKNILLEKINGEIPTYLGVFRV